jgi:phosphoribosylformylglycinamidine synthase subunit PurS
LYVQMVTMDTHTVEVVIENKPMARDPEGETIHRNLIIKGGYKQVTNVRAGKLLRMTVQADSGEMARQIVRKLCDDLRIYNPAAHICQVRLVG